MQVNLVVLTDKVPLLDKLTIPKQNILIVNEPSLTVLSGGATLKAVFVVKRIYGFLKANKAENCIAILPVAQWVMRLVKILSFFGRNRIRLFIYHRDVVFDASPLDTFGKRAFNTVNSILARITDYSHIFISEAVRENISKHFYTRRPQVVFNSQPFVEGDVSLGKTLLKTLGVIQKEQTYIVVIPGRLHKKKGHLFFIESLKGFLEIKREEGALFKVIIAGGGDMERDIIKKINEYNLGDRFVLTGMIDHTALLSLFKVADLIVIPSIHEGFGNVAVEAMMQGSLVLASATGGLKEIIKDGENGFLFETASQKSFVEKLDFIYSNRHEELISKKALLLDYFERFTLEKQVERLLQIYKD